jgi:hypothetical protein
VTTDTDLRNALLDAVDAEVDVAAFRARLRAAITDQDAGDDAASSGPVIPRIDIDAGEAFDLQRPATPENSRRRRHRWSSIAMAACLAGISAVVWLAVAGHISVTMASHHPSLTPDVLDGALFPGSTVLGVRHGTGSQTVRFPAGHASPGPFEHYMALLDCSSGQWVLHGRQTTTYGKCGTAVAGGSLGRTENSVDVEVQPDTTWQLAIAIEPNSRTNAMVQGGDSIDAHRGPVHRGNGVVTLRQPRYAFGRYELSITCSGTGFRLSGMKGAVHGDYAHTCFTGFAYVWNLDHVRLPATLQVHADPGTTWTVRLN